MYKEAEKQINRGLSLVPRLLLGTVSGLFGLMMILIAPPTDKGIFFYMFGGFCLLIFIACVTRGRVRQFVGSVIGGCIFLISFAYFASQLFGGGPIFSERSEPSIFNSSLFFFAFGLPGISYMLKARFGKLKSINKKS